MDLGGVLLVSSVSCVFMFVCCGMAVCHFHNLLPTSTVHKPIRFFFASAGLLLSVWFLRCDKKCCDPNTCDTNTNRERDRERQRETERDTERGTDPRPDQARFSVPLWSIVAGYYLLALLPQVIAIFRFAQCG